MDRILLAAPPEAVHRNLSVPRLVEEAIGRGEGILTDRGALAVQTGKYTGRSPLDKYLVDDPSVRDEVDWGPVNQPLAPDAFDRLLQRQLEYLRDRQVYVFDGYAGADPAYRLPIRVMTEHAWQCLFARQLFIRPAPGEVATHTPGFTVISTPGLAAGGPADGLRSEVCIAVHLGRRIISILGTQYAGEIKKSIFTVLNFLLPRQGVLPMHCAANVGPGGDVALFFGLSGTGKTTLSADPERHLIGDDEHGWSNAGIFNFEGGCYAKCIRLSAEKEPQIHAAIRFGAVLENVVVDPETRAPDFDSDALTENTRAAYPVDFIPGARVEGVAGHPQVIFFLTADAFGVLPPIARLTPEQALYHFLSGYTSKLAGTERGLKGPEATFSACFGAPFLPRRPAEYAALLGEKLKRHGVRVYLVNTGWQGGPVGVGQRMPLEYTRAMVRAALRGDLEAAGFDPDPVFQVLVPRACPGVPAHLLQPRTQWADPAAYDDQARRLAALFRRNFARFAGVPAAVQAAGPVDGA